MCVPTLCLSRASMPVRKIILLADDAASDRTEQCCGVCLPTLKNRGSHMSPTQASLHTRPVTSFATKVSPWLPATRLAYWTHPL